MMTSVGIGHSEAEMVSIGNLRAASALVVLTTVGNAAQNGTDATPTKTPSTAQVLPAMPDATASSVGHAALVGALRAQTDESGSDSYASIFVGATENHGGESQFADVLAKLKADNIAAANVSYGDLEMLKEHLGDTPDLDLVFRSTSQFAASDAANKAQSSQSISDDLYSGAGLSGGVKPITFQDIVTQVGAALSPGLADAFANKTLTIQNAYDVPNLVDAGANTYHYTGPADGRPTGFAGANLENTRFFTADGQNHLIALTQGQSLVYFSWPASGNDNAPSPAT